MKWRNNRDEECNTQVILMESSQQSASTHNDNISLTQELNELIDARTFPEETELHLTQDLNNLIDHVRTETDYTQRVTSRNLIVSMPLLLEAPSFQQGFRKGNAHGK